MQDQVFKTTPFAHQLEALLLSRDEKAYAFLMEMGTGKSKLMVDTVSWLFSQGHVNGLVLVAPKSVYTSWVEKQLPDHMPDSVPYRTLLWGPDTKTFRRQLEAMFVDEPLTLHVLVMNIDAVITDRGYDALERFMRSHNAILGVDESTIIKNPSSARTKVITKLGKLAKYRRIMTGSLIANYPLDSYAQFNFLEDGLLGCSSYYAFRNHYAVLRRRHLNGRNFDEVVGYQRLDELQRHLKKVSYRKLKSECLDLPPKLPPVKRYIELTPEQRRFYNDLRDMAVAELKSGHVVAAPLVITQLLRLRQTLCNIVPDGMGGNVFISEKDPRLEEVLNIVEEAGEQKVIVWSCFVPSILRLVKAINERFGDGFSAPFYGDVSREDREKLVDTFQDKSSKLRVLVMQPRTGGFGITLTAASVVVYHDNDWSLEVRLQSEDRAHRIGQTRAVTYIDLVAKDTVDEKVIESLQNKQELADQITGDNLVRLLTT